MEYQYRIEPSINEGEVNVIQAAGEAEALWVVTPTSAEISADDSDQNPAESDGCWPELPAEVVAEARALLDGEQDSVSGKFAVYVSDPRGWDIDCPDSEGQFFGEHNGEYFRDASAGGVDADLGVCGFVVFDTEAEAREFMRESRTSGDWANPDTGKIERPEYEICEL